MSRRVAALVAAGWVLAAGPVAADTAFRDARNGFEITYPAGWAERRAEDRAIVSMAGKTSNGSQSVCGVRVTPFGKSSKDTMDDKEFKSHFTIAQAEAGYAKGATFESETYASLAGLPSLSIEATFQNSKGVRVRAVQEVVYWKRNAIAINCAAPASSFNDFRADMKKIFGSFRRIPG